VLLAAVAVESVFFRHGLTWIFTDESQDVMVGVEPGMDTNGGWSATDCCDYVARAFQPEHAAADSPDRSSILIRTAKAEPCFHGESLRIPFSDHQAKKNF